MLLREIQNEIFRYAKINENLWKSWQCKESSLPQKEKKFYTIITRLKNDYLLDNYSVTFENTRPLKGKIFNDMILVSLDSNSTSTLKIIISIGENQDYTIILGKNYKHFKKSTEIINYLEKISQIITIEL
jgi:hypothetical protein